MAELEIKTGTIKNLRFYKHIKKGEVYFVNGFCLKEDTLESYVIYTHGHTGIIFTRPVAEFETRFELILRKKK